MYSVYHEITLELIALLSKFQTFTYMPSLCVILSRRSPSLPVELHDDHLDDLRVELCPVALRATVVAAGTAASAILLRFLSAVVVSLLLFAVLFLFVLALPPPFSTAFL